MQTTYPLAPPSPPTAVPASQAIALTLLGPSPAMAQLWAQMRRLAPYVRAVLLTGGPDCGQDAVARLLLDLSPHVHRAFLQMTAADIEARHLRTGGLATLPTDLLLYVPDVHNLSSGAQHALLRLLRLRRARAFTLIAAAEVDLRMLVSTGHFLIELADALSTVRLAIPGLNQRMEDMPMLVSQLLGAKCAELGRQVPRTSETFLRACMEYAWPGNLREMEELLGWLCTHSPGTELHVEDFRLAVAARRSSRNSDGSVVRMVPLDRVVQEHLSAVLGACCGNKLRAAEVLGISRSTLYRMLDSASASDRAPLSLAS